MYLDSGFPAWYEKASRLVTSLHIEDPKVSAAMRRVPRHRFVSRGLWPTAYVDTPLPVGPEATVSAPHMVAMQLMTAEVSPGMNIMELGSGSGYLLAIATLLTGTGGRATGVEMERTLVDRSTAALTEIGFTLIHPERSAEPGVESQAIGPLPGKLAGRIHIHQGDGREGCRHFRPYDRIIVSYATPPPDGEEWLGQLSQEGVMVAPVVREDATWLERWHRGPKGWEVKKGPPCLFVSRKPPA